MKRVRKQRKLFIFGLILLLIGCGILLYPHILQIFYKIKTESMFRQFEETTENVRDANPEKYARLYEEMKNYNEELIKNNQENLADPYAYANPAIRLEEYGVENGIAGYIKIPVMDLELPLYLGANEENMSKGAAQLTASVNFVSSISALTGRKLSMTISTFFFSAIGFSLFNICSSKSLIFTC